MAELADAVIRIEHLFKEYATDAGPVPVLKDVSVSVASGEFVAVMGPSGSGKSTFMNILGCLDVATTGRYLLDGKDAGTLDGDELARLRNQVIGFVFQGFNLLPRATLEDNVALPLIYRGTPRGERLARAHEMLDKVGLGAYYRSRPNQISGGQQQRVAIARALVTRPRLILADEPTGNLDTATGREIMALFTELNRQDGITIVLVTHEPDIAGHAQRLVRLADGRVIYDGLVEHAQAHHLEKTL
ncbi:MAG: macrolide ABC transporter ATP-binding protein [Betaproteobacteria bacterium HGW-Betaproteobacteria-11]|nr:MAG: macrolide ABC transporter ATP-binding protein [Betaproteobacteria bacterium HGW-Betaproteobacteria-11]